MIVGNASKNGLQNRRREKNSCEHRFGFRIALREGAREKVTDRVRRVLTSKNSRQRPYESSIQTDRQAGRKNIVPGEGEQKKKKKGREREREDTIFSIINFLLGTVGQRSHSNQLSSFVRHTHTESGEGYKYRTKQQKQQQRGEREKSWKAFK